MNCKCGQPAHPLYGSMCENCYADMSQAVVGSNRDYRRRAIRPVEDSGPDGQELNQDTLGGLGRSDRHRRGKEPAP